MKFNEQLKKHIWNLVVKMLANRLAKFTFIILVWIISLELLTLIGLLNKVDSNLLIVANLAVFFFALTASPTTWVIKGPFGFEAGSNDPKHTHVTFNENSHQGQVDVREYGDKKDSDRLIKISNELKKKI
jgi:hypothetical protein